MCGALCGQISSTSTTSNLNFYNMKNSRSEVDINTREYAEIQDEQDPLKHLRAEFILPTKADLKRKTLAKSGSVCLLL